MGASRTSLAAAPDGFNTLALSGARVDPAYCLAQCPTPDATTQAILSGRLSVFSCDPAEA